MLDFKNILGIMGSLDMDAINQLTDILKDAQRREAKGVILDFLQDWKQIKDDLAAIKKKLEVD